MIVYTVQSVNKLAGGVINLLNGLTRRNRLPIMKRLGLVAPDVTFEEITGPITCRTEKFTKVWMMWKSNPYKAALMIIWLHHPQTMIIKSSEKAVFYRSGSFEEFYEYVRFSKQF